MQRAEEGPYAPDIGLHRLRAEVILLGSDNGVLPEAAAALQLDDEAPQVVRAGSGYLPVAAQEVHEILHAGQDPLHCPRAFDLGPGTDGVGGHRLADCDHLPVLTQTA